MLLLLWLAIALGPDGRVASEPQYDLARYLALAADYGSANHAGALAEIRRWPPDALSAAVHDLRRQGQRLRPVATDPRDIAFGTVEAAVLMHAEGGLLALHEVSDAEAKAQLQASVTLFEWSREAAAGLEVRPRIARRDYYLALAAGALAIGFPSTALPFAEKARLGAPLDPEVQLVYGCVAEGLAREHSLRHEESRARSWGNQAEAALRDAIALDGDLLEARLHLGGIRIDRGRLLQAEPRLRDVEAGTSDRRQLYLARLLLGRLEERRGRVEEAIAFYRRALDAWPDSQAAPLALGHAIEVSSSPGAARPLVAATLFASRRLDRSPDPWWLYLFGPPGLARAALDRLWARALDR